MGGGSNDFSALSINGDAVNYSGSVEFRQNNTLLLAMSPPAVTNNVDFDIWNYRNGFLRFGTNNQLALYMAPTQRVGIAGVNNPTARLHLPSSGGAAESAPLKFTSGTNTSTPEAGAMEYDGTNLRFSIGTGDSDRRIMAVGLTGSITHDFADTNEQQSRDVTLTVTGATEGDVVSLGVPNGAVSANTCYTAWVSAANTVTIRFNNYSSGSVNPGNGTFKVFVTKY
jgi:hypothetical protein